MLQTQPYLMVAAAGNADWATSKRRCNCCCSGCSSLLAFFVTAMVCHGQLAGDRPAGSHLTEFYSVDVAGRAFWAGCSMPWWPRWFSRATVEYPLMLAVACLLRPDTRGARGHAEHRLQRAGAARGDPADLRRTGVWIVAIGDGTGRLAGLGGHGGQIGAGGAGDGRGLSPRPAAVRVRAGSCRRVGREPVLSRGKRTRDRMRSGVFSACSA